MKRINILTDPKIAALYADAPPAELENFKIFLKAYPYRHALLGGTDWAYLATHQNGADILVLPGALCAPEVGWKTIAALAEKYRVIAPEYPPLKRMDDLVDGIAAILRQQGVTRAHVLGGSYGGFVAQVFVRRHPEMTRSLVLSHTLPPYPESVEQLEKTLRWLGLLPEKVLCWLMGKRLSGLLPEKTPKTAVLHAIYQEMLRFRLTKADLLALLWRTADFNCREFTPADLAAWPGRALLALTDDDPGTPEDVRAKLQALYPQAKMHLFHGGGHATSVVKQDEYLVVVNEFLRDAI